LICPFCSQRNPRRARRCIFCDNLPTASADETAVWPPRQQQRPENLPARQPDALRKLNELQREETRRQDLYVTIAGIVVVVVVVLYGLIRVKCG
jgi:hypothetical protein